MGIKKQRKPQDRFKLVLPSYSDGTTTFRGGVYDEYGFGDHHCLSNFMRKYNPGIPELTQHYWERFKAGDKAVDIRIYTNNRTESTRNVPELGELRRYLNEKTGVTLTELEKKRYLDLYTAYRSIENLNNSKEEPRLTKKQQKRREKARQDAMQPKLF